MRNYRLRLEQVRVVRTEQSNVFWTSSPKTNTKNLVHTNCILHKVCNEALEFLFCWQVSVKALRKQCASSPATAWLCRESAIMFITLRQHKWQKCRWLIKASLSLTVKKCNVTEWNFFFRPSFFLKIYFVYVRPENFQLPKRQVKRTSVIKSKT